MWHRAIHFSSTFFLEFQSGISNVQSTTIGVLCVVKMDSNGNYLHSHAGINEAQIQNTELRIYPNPATNELHIVQSAMGNGQYAMGNRQLAMSMFDITGKCIFQSAMSNGQQAIGNKQMTIDVSGLSEGMYFVRITDANGISVKTEKVAVLR